MNAKPYSMRIGPKNKKVVKKSGGKYGESGAFVSLRNIVGLAETTRRMAWLMSCTSAGSMLRTNDALYQNSTEKIREL